MAKFPLCNSMLLWFTSYFENRRQYVKVNSCTSEIFGVPSSVGQGSVLGPILFLIFFNDSDDDITNSLILNFADDKKIAHKIKHQDDIIHLQNAINRFIDWCDLNGLAVNTMKCRVMTYFLKKITLHADYYIKTELVKRTDKIRDLGDIFDSSFTSHVEYITNKANAILCIL